MDIKIGIVLNYKNAEKKKDELYCLNSEKWLKIDKIHQPFSIMRKNKKCIPADVAIGVFLESFKDPDVKIIIDYILPDEISIPRFKSNHIVFIIIYDLLEAFHLSNKSHFQNFKHTLQNSPNVYPPYIYQKFINNKCTYYSYLAAKKIPVAPTHCITKEKWLNRDSDKYVSGLLSKVKHKISDFESWTNIFIYPGYKFKLVDCLLTNFHLPTTTLLMLVCAFGGKELMLKAYQEAVEQKCRTPSFSHMTSGHSKPPSMNEVLYDCRLQRTERTDESLQKRQCLSLY